MDVPVSMFMWQLRCTVRKHEFLRNQCCRYVAACSSKLCFRYFSLSSWQLKHNENMAYYFQVSGVSKLSMMPRMEVFSI